MKKELNLGELCDAIQRKADEIGELESQLANLKHEEGLLKSQLETKMKQEGTTSARGSLATVSRTSSMIYVAHDWDDVYKFINRNNAPYILQRRLSMEAVRDLVEKRRGKELPGTKSFEQFRLNVRRIKDGT